MTPKENRYIQNVGHCAGQLTQFLQVNGMEQGGRGGSCELPLTKRDTTSKGHVWTLFEY